jgi:hypothetical protein
MKLYHNEKDDSEIGKLKKIQQKKKKRYGGNKKK